MKIIKQVTVDIVIFTIQEGILKVLLIKRAIPPFLGQFAIPGGFVQENEDLDPRGRVITVAYFALISPDRTLTAGSDAAAAAWYPVDQLPPLAFDHATIFDYALPRIRNQTA